MCVWGGGGVVVKYKCMGRERIWFAVQPHFIVPLTLKWVGGVIFHKGFHLFLFVVVFVCRWKIIYDVCVGLLLFFIIIIINTSLFQFMCKNILRSFFNYKSRCVGIFSIAFVEIGSINDEWCSQTIQVSTVFGIVNIILEEHLQ